MSKSTLTRRALVASTAAMPAAAAFGLPAAAEPAAPDPIFAAMEQDESANRAFWARCAYEDALVEAGQKLPPVPGDHRTPEMVAIVNASIAAREELAATSPTTLAGLAAYLDFVVAQSDALSTEDAFVFAFDGDDETLTFVRSIARSARALASMS